MHRRRRPRDAALGAFVAGLDAESRDSMLAALTRRQFSAGAALFHQGDAPSHLLQIRDGLVRVVQVSPGGAETTLHILGPGDLVGCLAVVQQFPFPATAIAIQNTTVSSWSAAQIRDLMNRYPRVSACLLRDVGDRAQEMANRLVETLHKDVNQRIASALLRLSDLVGEDLEWGRQIKAPVTRKEIAELSGATYFTVSRALGDWQKQGWICTGRQRIVVLAPDKLAQIAGPSSFGA